MLFRHRWNPAVKIFIRIFPMGGSRSLTNEGGLRSVLGRGVMVTPNSHRILDTANLKSEVGRGLAPKERG